ncbi:hypothetical protein G4228_014627, partial [Cervus hanglu yarkandensis]
DILLLADEKFDFDLSLSSSSANEDDEVFFGPIGHKERCIAASLELNNQIPQEPPLPASERHFTWSPLTGEKFVEVYKEAHLLAFQIQSNGRTKAVQAAQPEDPGSQGVERFIQESKLKVNLFDRENEMKKSPKSLKRETYCLLDGLWRAPLLPGTQPTSSTTLPASPAQASRPETSGMPPASCPSLPAEPSAAQPPNQAGAPKKPLATPIPRPRPRPLASPLPASARRLSSEPQKKSTVRTAPAREGDGQPASRRPDLSPDGSCSPPSAVPQALDFSPEKSDFTFSQSITAEVALDQAQPPEATAPSEALLVDVKLDQLSLAVEAVATAPDDCPLIDFCRSPEAAVALPSGSGPLADLLTNTPEAPRRAAAKPPDEVGQASLIDLASPLILLSPGADKENMESPLLKF